MAFYTFCDLLECSNYEVWARKLKSAAERLKTVGVLNTCCLHVVAESGYTQMYLNEHYCYFVIRKHFQFICILFYGIGQICVMTYL